MPEMGQARMTHSKIICIIQARMGSSRLPGKVLAELAGRTLLDQVIGRLRGAKTLSQIVVATSDLPQDRAIVDHCEANGYAYFVGSHDDVLNRFARAAEQFAADIVVRVTADCPLIDPAIVDKVVASLLADPKLDCACNVFPRRTFPRGLDVEAMTRTTLRKLDVSCRESRHREHVSLAIYENLNEFRIGSLISDQDRSDLRWTVDEQSDLLLIREMYNAFTGRNFSWVDCLRAYRQHPQWRTINAHVEQKAA